LKEFGTQEPIVVKDCQNTYVGLCGFRIGNDNE